MIASWMLYGTVISLLLAIAALCFERVLPLSVPRRALWTGAMVGTVLVPLIDLGWRTAKADPVGSGATWSEPGQLAAFTSISAEAIQLPVGGSAWIDTFLIALWVTLSAALLLAGAASLGRIRRGVRRWPRAEVNGRRVHIAPGVGPAVAGFLRGVIVLPTWALQLSEREREAMLRHEEEHLRRGDPLLLFGAYLFVTLMPWNLPLWWMVHRLRLAVELDCDARVLRAGTDPRAYGDLLLHVATAHRGLRGAGALLFGHPTFLERRIRSLVRREPRGRGILLAGTAVAVSLLLVACELKTPLQPPAPAPAADPPPAATTELSAAPTFTPFEERPSLLERQAMGAAIERHYPQLLKDAGIGGQVTLWVFIEADGEVGNTLVVNGSGHPELDAAAQAAMAEARFQPARNGGVPVPVWIQIPITFMPPSDAEPAAAAAPASTPFTIPPPPERLEGLARAPGPEPTFTPFDERPSLVTRAAFAAALDAYYPPTLRNAGIGGTAIHWVLIDESGVVVATRLASGSGHDALDAAAARALREAIFEPARMEGQPTAVWLQIPVTFLAG